MRRIKRFLLGSALVVLLAGAIGIVTGCDDDYHHRRVYPGRTRYYTPPRHRRGYVRVPPPHYRGRPPIHRRRPPGWDRDDWEDHLEDLEDAREDYLEDLKDAREDYLEDLKDAREDLYDD